MRLKEIYSRSNVGFKNYMLDPEFDPYLVWDRVPYYLSKLVEQNEDILHLMVQHAQQQKFPDINDDLEHDPEIYVTNFVYQMEPEDWYSLPSKVTSRFERKYQEELESYVLIHRPFDAPTHMYLSPSSTKLLKRTTWLVHFSEYASSIAEEGFRYGVDGMDKLGLTTYMSKHDKEFGGYNFAVKALSREAKSIAIDEKYGQDAVLFQNSGFEAYHHGDEENQIVFYGKDVDPRNIILLEKHDGDWCVKPHPSKQEHYDNKFSSRDGSIICSGKYEDMAKWVINHHRQYAKVLYGY